MQILAHMSICLLKHLMSILLTADIGRAIAQRDLLCDAEDSGMETGGGGTKRMPAAKL
ncbi:MAG: hypothetical protein HPY65_17885 [Syntrophaceae bacterium]|nr:hypothetical protein [Syntrophaceae bacterium]